MVLNQFRKVFEKGLDAARINKRAVYEAVDELAKAGHVSSKDAKRLVATVASSAIRAEKKLGQIMKNEVDRQLKRKGYCRREEVLKMKKRISELEKKLKSKKK